jgi:hypothetical protein
VLCETLKKYPTYSLSCSILSFKERRCITKRKTAHAIVSEAYDEIEKLKPTNNEIGAYADLHEGEYGVVTCSKYHGGDYYFLRFHDTWKQKIGGRVHIDVGYVDEENIHEEIGVVHLMLDKDHAPDFVQFIKQRR